MMVILLMIMQKEMGNVFMKMVNIIQVNGKIIHSMEKGNYIIKMEILNMMVILLMINLKEMGNIFGKMLNIIQVNLKMIYSMENE